jgi:hypothetical protein
MRYPIEKKKAEDRQREHGGTAPGKEKTLPLNLEEVKGETIEILAKEAKVSPMTYRALSKINKEGSEELKQAVREKKVSASRGAKIAELPSKKIGNHPLIFLCRFVGLAGRSVASGSLSFT